jgi:hypothetical protein
MLHYGSLPLVVLKKTPWNCMKYGSRNLPKAGQDFLEIKILMDEILAESWQMFQLKVCGGLRKLESW